MQQIQERAAAGKREEEGRGAAAAVGRAAAGDAGAAAGVEKGEAAAHTTVTPAADSQAAAAAAAGEGQGPGGLVWRRKAHRGESEAGTDKEERQLPHRDPHRCYHCHHRDPVIRLVHPHAHHHAHPHAHRHAHPSCCMAELLRLWR
ncbi:unnamed protein product [Closterium sp. NIES-53]